MHAAAFRAADLAGSYEARRVPSAELASAVTSLRTRDVLGANVSLPHKEAVVPLLDDLTPAARSVGAVNTIVRDGETLLGDNTDAPGLMAALSEVGAPKSGLAVVLGAGGAARAGVFALREAGFEVHVCNRNLDKAARLAEEFGVSWNAFGDVPWSDAALVVNATSAGLNAPDESPLPTFPPLPSNAFVYDMVYAPEDTRLVREARAAGSRAESGLSMLAQQARLSFLAWTGVDVSVKVFLNAAREAHARALK
ncbi:shikimate dehydrogenase [Deinococcus yavapaiensis KR-236]|uniref:shikimate dehydrogenase (NADP(+)) n=2 Tax=Deinococcus TaxID=1298 RepID=A0A318SFT4_9DEIO|nr:shikimate dehydrogenase [Deinococcus yavapaiensis KR-236]